MRSLKLRRNKDAVHLALNDKKSLLDEGSEEYRLFIEVGIVFPRTN